MGDDRPQRFGWEPGDYMATCRLPEGCGCTFIGDKRAYLCADCAYAMPDVTPAEAKPLKIYLAGPMTGIVEFNFPAFHAAAAQLRAEGHEVFNPAEADIERHDGVDISIGNVNGDPAVAAAQHGFDRRVALGQDLDWICAEADAVALLPGWQASKGATAERAVALALGLQIIALVPK